MATPASKRKNFEESSPQKKGSKKAKQTPPEKCVTCNKVIKQECQWCRKWEHRVCTGLSQSEYNTLTNSSNKMMFLHSVFL